MADDTFELSYTGAEIQTLLSFLDSLNEDGAYFKERRTTTTYPDQLTENGWYFIQEPHLIDPGLANNGGYIFNARTTHDSYIQLQLFVSIGNPKVIQYRARLSATEWTDWTTILDSISGIDSSLSASGKAADAKVVGDQLILAAKQQGIISASVTALTTLTANGWYFIPRSYFTNITDLPSGRSSTNHAMVYVFNINVDGLWQLFIQPNTSDAWLRVVAPTSASEWTSLSRNTDITALLNSKLLSTIENTDADLIPDNNYYVYGSGDSALHVPGTGSAGAILPVKKDGNTGYQIAFDYTTEAPYYRVKKAGTWSLWRKLSTDGIVKSRPAVVRQGSQSGGIVESLRIYIPSHTGYIEYDFGHYVIPNDNCDVWRIYNAHFRDHEYTRVKQFTESGEWECAIRLAGRDDFSGGSTHGDEVLTDDGIIFFMDGKKITDLTTLTNTEFDAFIIVRNSILYDPADHTTEIARHGCEYIFTIDGVTVNQSVEWLVSESVYRAYLAMFPASKNCFNHIYTDINQSFVDLTTVTFPMNRNGVKKAVTFGDDVVAEFKIDSYPTGFAGGDKFSLTDNGGLNYYKQYYYVAENYSVSSGDLWQSTTTYKIDSQ